jgi:uncharacterized phage-like protein YoqJ
MKGNKNICCFFGQKPIKFHFGFDEEHPDCIRLKELLAAEIEKMSIKGVDTYLTGMSMGVDIWAAEIILKLRQTQPNSGIHLIAVIPYEGQANRWSVEYRERYFNILEQVDDTVTLQTQYVEGCMQAYNRHMVNVSDHMIAVCNGDKGGTQAKVDFALAKGLNIVVINPDTLKAAHFPPNVIELFK